MSWLRLRTLEAIGALAVQPAVAAARDELQLLLASTLVQRLSLILGLGFALTIVAGLVTRSLISRIDRALSAAMANAQRIGQGVRSEPVPISGVPEVAAIERSLENMRQALASTTISRDFLDDVLNSMSDAVLVMSPNGRVRSANAAASELFGYSAAELPGTIVSELIAPEHREAFDERGLEAGVGETVVRTQRGQTIPVAVSLSPLESPDASNRGTILVLRDITDRKRAERRIRYLARFDTLTKMPNRMQFQHLLHQSITRNQRQGSGLALLYVDVDNFKEVNDTFGHETGDRVLETLSERLARVLPKESVVGRLAGDEFAIFAEAVDGSLDALHDQAAALARMVLTEIAKPMHMGDPEIDVTASIGIALVPEHADNVIDLIRNADAAMYHAKRAGRNCHVFYAPEMNAAAVERLLLKSKLRRALERDEFVVRYQPKVDLASGEVVGGEALLRWRLPGHGEIAPSQFIPLAEESRLILDIGAWVLNQVCSDYSAWQAARSRSGTHRDQPLAEGVEPGQFHSALPVGVRAAQRFRRRASNWRSPRRP